MPGTGDGYNGYSPHNGTGRAGSSSQGIAMHYQSNRQAGASSAINGSDPAVWHIPYDRENPEFHRTRQGDDDKNQVWRDGQGDSYSARMEIHENDSIRKEFRNLSAKDSKKKLQELDKEALNRGSRLYRPGFGTRYLKEVTLWTNLFPIRIQAKNLPKVYMYKCKIQTVDKNDPSPDQKIKGGHAKKIFQQALKALAEGTTYATDFKDRIVILGEMKFGGSDQLNDIVSASTELQDMKALNSQVLQIQYLLDGKNKNGRPLIYDVFFANEHVFDMADLANCLKSGKTPPAKKEVEAVATIIGHAPRADPDISTFGSGKFFKNDTGHRVHTDPPDMLGVLRGFSQTIRPATQQLLLNVNITYSVFLPRINIGRWLRVWQARRRWDQDPRTREKDLEFLHRAISKIKVLYKKPRARGNSKQAGGSYQSPTWSEQSRPDCDEVEITIAGFARHRDGCSNKKSTNGSSSTRCSGTKCNELCQASKRTCERGLKTDGDFPNANQVEFRCTKHGDVFHTVYQHFSQEYHSRFRHPTLPLINRGRPDNPIYIPAERCWIIFGQQAPLKLDARAQQRMMDFSCRRPYQNAYSICNDGLEVLQLKGTRSGQTDSFLKKFGISIGEKLIQVPGRELQAPLLQYRDEKKEFITPMSGSWNLNENGKFVKPSSKPWSFLILKSAPHTVQMPPPGGHCPTPPEGEDLVSKGIEELSRQMKLLGMTDSPFYPLKDTKGKVILAPHYVNGVGDALIKNLSDKLKEAKGRWGVDIIIVVFPKKQDAAFYNKLKYLGDVVHGIHTVCIISQKFMGLVDVWEVDDATQKDGEQNDGKQKGGKQKGRKQKGVKMKRAQTEVDGELMWEREWEASADYFANICLKMNLKLGGTNHELYQANSNDNIIFGKNERRELKGMPKLKGATMIVGYDVIHPTGLDTEGLQSRVGLVSSVDQESLAQWSGCYWAQNAGCETMEKNTETFQEKFGSRLEVWAKQNHHKFPENIVIFRDGVSESQYEKVIEDELSQIKKICREKYKKAVSSNNQSLEAVLPKITLVVSVKRHSTRFYPSDPKDMINVKSRNIRNGTVVDRGATDLHYWEFFLTAQAAIKGTARPARYVVLHDEIFRTGGNGSRAADMLQEYTHKLCYVFGRATKAVSLCTPAYYADILCTRAQAYASVLRDDDKNTYFKSLLASNIDDILEARAKICKEALTGPAFQAMLGKISSARASSKDLLEESEKQMLSKFTLDFLYQRPKEYEAFLETPPVKAMLKKIKKAKILNPKETEMFNKVTTDLESTKWIKEGIIHPDLKNSMFWI